MPVFRALQLHSYDFRGGSKRETTGILMWSKVYTLHTNDKEVAVVLLDTQVTYVSQKTAIPSNMFM